MESRSGHRGTRAIQRMVEYAPSTGGLALWVAHRDVEDDPRHPAPAVQTDGTTIRYGAAFEALPLEQQAGLVAHEVLHVALRHAQRYTDLQALVGDVDLRLFNLCADAIVDSALSHATWLRLPPSAVLIDRLLAEVLGLQQTIDAALLEWDVERLYREIDDRKGGGRGGRAGRAASSGGGSERAATEATAATAATQARSSESRADGPRSMRARKLAAEAGAHADLSPEPQSAAAPEDEAEAARAWSERLVRGHAGDGALSMLRSLVADLPRSQVPWAQVLRTRLARSLAPRRDVSWSRPSRSYIANQGRAGPGRRMPWEPGTSASKAVARLALVVDVSGSIDDELLDRFACEIDAITRRLESGLVLVVGDDRVRRVEQLAPGHCGLRELPFDGGGGTDFTPLLEEADRHRPDIGVVLTDLDGPARFRPSWPVLWAVPPANRDAMAPFGRVLVLR